jgi:hypothetical protein
MSAYDVATLPIASSVVTGNAFKETSSDVFPDTSPDVCPEVSRNVFEDVDQMQVISLCTPDLAKLNLRKETERVMNVLYVWLCSALADMPINGNIWRSDAPFNNQIFIPVSTAPGWMREQATTYNTHVIVRVMVCETFKAGHVVCRLRYAEVWKEEPEDTPCWIETMTRSFGCPTLYSDLLYYTLNDLKDALLRVLDYLSGVPNLNSESYYDSN